MPPALIHDSRFRTVAPKAFAFPGDNFYEIGGTDDFLRWAVPLVKQGADGVLQIGRAGRCATAGGLCAAMSG